MARYALVEAQAHLAAAYEMPQGAEQTPAVDRTTIETILDWAILFYYRAHMVELDELLERHRAAIDRLDDDTLRMWWLIWRGHATGFRLDQTHNMEFLDAAVDIALRTGDEAGMAYARTWQIWGHFVTGHPEAAIEAAEDIEEWVTANRYDDAYPYLKSRGTLAYVLASAGRGDEVRQMCNELIEFGIEVGNNRCIAYGHQGLAFLDTLALSHSSAITKGEQARAIAKDPIYSETAYLTVAAAATLDSRTEVARMAVAELRSALDAGVDLPAPLFVSLAEGATRMSDGELTPGIAQLMTVRDEARNATRMWEHLFAELYIGAIFARMVTGEATRDLKHLARNPGFLKYVRRARKEAEPRLRAALNESLELGFDGVRPVIEFELAKLLIHTGDKAEARRLLESALAAIGSDEAAEGIERVRALLTAM
jgi:tetratricopeptide (TPR) repeat protein